MNKKILEIELSNLKDYTVKKPSLEQYTTPSTIAASLVWSAYMKGDIENKVVADFGCGNGILGIGCLLLGAKKVVFIDIDKRAIDTAKDNCSSLGLSNIEFVNKDVLDITEHFDTILMNPPFGVQTRGLDVLFLKQASSLSKVFYTIYKGDGLKIISRELPNKTAIILEETELLLKKQFSFHTKEKEKTKIILVKIL